MDDLDLQKELKRCNKYVDSREELAKVLTKVKSELKSDYINSLLSHVYIRVAKMTQAELMAIPEYEWLK